MSVNATNRRMLTDYLIGQHASSTFGRNYVLNSSGFDGTTNITVSGTATVAKNTTTPLTSLSDLAITLPSNATDGVTWTLNTLDKELKGQNCELRLTYSAASIGSAVQAQILIGGVLSASSSALSVSTSSQTISLNVPCGDLTGATTVRVQNATGNTGTSALNVASVTYGRATNIGSSTFVTDWATYTLTIGAVTTAPTLGTNTQTATWRRVGDSMEIAYQMSMTTNGSSIGSGSYLFPIPSGYTIDSTKAIVAANVIGQGATVLGTCSVGLTTSSATNYATHGIAFAYNTTNIALAVQPIGSLGQLNGIGSTAFNTGTAPVYYSFNVLVPISGWSASQQAVTAQQADYDWTAYTPTFTGFGTPSAVEFQQKRNGSDVLIRGKFTSGTTTAVEGRISLPSGLTSSDTTKIASIQLAGTHGNSAVEAYGGGVLIEPSVTYMTFSKQGAGSAILDKLNAGSVVATGNTMTMYARIPIQGWVQTNSAPLLVGSVTSNSAGAERVERISFNGGNASTVCSGTCTIVSQSGGQTITRTGLGAYTLTFSNAFSAPPVCTCSSSAPGTSNSICSTLAAASTTTSVFIGTGQISSNVDSVASVICVGPR